MDRRADELLDVLAQHDLTHAAAPAPAALAQLPAPVPGFTGRDDDLAVLAGLLDLLRPNKSEPKRARLTCPDRARPRP